jgi:SNF2 family DNA or RNA helicase
MLVQTPPVVDVPDELRVQVENGRPRPWLRLQPSRYRPEQLEAQVLCDYDGMPVQPDRPYPIVRSEDGSRVVRRDVAAERSFTQVLQGLGFKRDWSADRNEQVPQIASRHLPRVVRTLLADGWRVEAKGVTYRQPAATSLRVTSGIDWFDLEGHADYGNQQVALPELLAALRRGDGFVTLDDGTMGLLPEAWLQKQGMLASFASPDGDRLRFKASQVALLDALLAERPEATCDEAFARARAELQAFDGIAPLDPPSSFTGTLRGYQREGLGWLLFLQRFGFGGCLADDMGLGKTIMVLAALTHAQESAGAASSKAKALSVPTAAHRPSLVVAPRSLVFNWRNEAARFAPGLRVLEYTGGGRTALRDAMPDHDLVLTTYGTLRRDAEPLAQIPFHYVVLDEAQAIKNAGSASAKTTRLLQARHRLALSGTPIENHLGELWSLFEFLNPGVLGTASAFQGTTARSLDEASVTTLARGLRPFILRRTKAQVAPELPQKTEQTIYCELEKPQRALYDQLRDHYRTTLLDRVARTGLGRSKIQVLEALLRLRQAACHPGLIDAKRTKEPSAKLDVLLPHIAQAVDEGHKTLVFSQFTSLLAILRTRLDADGVAYEYLDGRTRDREAKVERFQTDPACRLFLISLKAGGVGLNLTAAEYVFLLDPWWNPAVEAQAIDRAHRIGQARHVFAYRLIAKDTVEERVLELQQHKRKLADAVLSADGSLLKELKREDLEMLLS